MSERERAETKNKPTTNQNTARVQSTDQGSCGNGLCTPERASSSSPIVGSRVRPRERDKGHGSAEHIDALLGEFLDERKQHGNFNVHK